MIDTNYQEFIRRNYIEDELKYHFTSLTKLTIRIMYRAKSRI